MDHSEPTSSTTHLPQVLESKLSTEQRKDYNVAVQAAASVLNRRVRVLRLIRDAYIKLHSEDEALRRLRGDLMQLLRAMKAWALGRYPQLPWRALILSCAAVVYFVLPVDLIPDFIPGVGFLDDAVVIGGVVRALKSDLDQFEQWRQQRLEETSTALS